MKRFLQRRIAKPSPGAAPTRPRISPLLPLALAGFLLSAPATSRADVLFSDDFNQGIPGWTSVQPRAVYLGGSLCWEYDIAAQAIVERSDVYTDASSFSTSAIAPMLINGTVAHPPFSYSARLTAGDDDAFGLIFGYQNESNFYRLGFARQARNGFPRQGWTIDRKSNGVTSVVAGPSTSFNNTAGRPFDVSLSVDASNRLTLTVVDDPAGAATSHLLVNAQRLPAAADGKVGAFTWGMSGGTPRGFLIQNLSLSPSPLQGDPEWARVWTPVIPPRSDGSTTLAGGLGQAHWFLKTATNGPAASMEEDSDSGSGWDPSGRVDFIGPTLVAGDPAWSNYAVSVRITPFDAQGHGIVLRYQNPSNFYRIAIRQTHTSGWGMRPGLSIQKNINGAYSQIYADSPVRFSPPTGVPYDLVAHIASNTLNILVVADPDGAAQLTTYGPFDIRGLDSGKIGLCDWLMLRTQFDRVQVLDGAALHVFAPLGSPSPARGLSSFLPGQRVEASAGDATNEPGVRHSATGWIGTGSAPPSGSGSHVSFDLHTFSTLRWLWKTEFLVSASNDPGGRVTGPSDEWLAEGSRIQITALPDRGFLFDGWEGDLQSRTATLDLTVDRPLALNACFTPDTDEDGLPDEWERAYWGDLRYGPDDDPDQDGNAVRAELELGTDPHQADVLRIDPAESAPASPRLTVWNNTGARCALERCGALGGAWTTISNNVREGDIAPSLPSGNSFLRLSQPPAPPDVPSFKPRSWSLVVLPDTQNYSATNPALFMDQTRWILANKDRHNIQYVLHLGDLVDNDALPVQWTNAQAALSLLDGQVPYAIVPGNHDYSQLWPNRSSRISAYFPPNHFQSWPTFGGVKDPGKIENSFHLFSAGGSDWIVLALEFGPRNAVIHWANSILDRYPNRRAILITHAFLYLDNTRYDWAAKGDAQAWNPHSYLIDYDADGTNDGEELWQKLIRRHPQVAFVLNGHVVSGGAARLASTNDAGHVVHQMLSNYQSAPLGGGAFLRILEFLPNGDKVQVKTFSPYDGTYKTDPQNQFLLDLRPRSR